MKAQCLTIVVFALCCLAARPVPEKIESLSQLRKAASDAEVAVIDFTVPEPEEAAERALSDRYFNKPLDERFSGVTTSDWERKWDLMAEVFVEKAVDGKLDSESLRACLRSLNHGHTIETALCPVPPGCTLPPENETKDKEAKRLREEQAKYDALMEERKAHPDNWESPEATIPIGAYLAKYARGSCWIIVCKWEVANGSHLGHIRVWALDTLSHKTVAYVTCD
jgi:hypothetical protein